MLYTDRMWWTFRKILGVLCVLMGVIFLITPFTPGAGILLFVGAELLGLTFLLPKPVREYWERLKASWHKWFTHKQKPPKDPL